MTTKNANGIAAVRSLYNKLNEKPHDDEMILELDCRLLKKTESINLCGKLAVHQICDNEKCKYSHNVQEFMDKKADGLPYDCPYGENCKYGLKCLLRPTVEATAEPLENSPGYETLNSLRKKKYKFPKFERQPDQLEAIKGVEPSTIGYIAPTSREISAYKSRKRKEMFKSGNTYLAPLTTHGHVAFRRLCKSFGADITCGEMALSTSLLQGKNSNWLTLRRHTSEQQFGVQIAAKHADTVFNTCHLIKNECNVDFIDLNLCCPIDTAYERGIGASLLIKRNNLEKIIKAMSKALTHVPTSPLAMDTTINDPEEKMPLFTVKMRTGVKDGKNLAHSFLPILEENNFDMASIHGRSREQRYSKLADWDYMDECAQLCDKMSFFGNGDITSYTEYDNYMDTTSVDGILIGRGALIKPWIFEEIKEKRHIDKSSTERMEMIKQFMLYGMEHFGTDSVGIERTRRFFCEWWSFSHRYVPHPILEHIPHKINQRPQSWWGRNALETWLSSTDPGDWIRLSEVYLGPSDEKFTFSPKHKAESYK